MESPAQSTSETDYFVGGLEDIEPAWLSTTSFSESCGSCISRISSLCLDGKSNESPECSGGISFPDNFEKSDVVREVSLESILKCNDPSCSKKDENVFNEEDSPFAVLGSSQSLSSSTKTVYASPRSNSEEQFYCQLSKSGLSEKAIQRRGTLYRERAPSENALDFNNLCCIRESKLSHSLHDVSSIPSNGLKNPSRRSANVGFSLSALSMRNRSRDSGFLHSESLLSLSSGGRNYDHVESKVKQYIQSIKDADAVRRKERAKSKNILFSNPKQEDKVSESQEDPELIHLVRKMQYDMEEKDRLLLKLQEDYNSLLGKYAEAENKIDKLRFGWHENTPSSALGSSTFGQRTQASNKTMLKQLKQPSDLPDIDDSSLTSSMFLSNFESIESPDSSYHFKEERSRHANLKNGLKKEVTVSAPLRPISRLYCTSVRLDRIVPPLNSKSPVEARSFFPRRGQSPASSISKIKNQTLDMTAREGTADTGIGSFCQDEISATALQENAEPIGQLPPEDPILKVQRWQKSLHSPSHSEFSTKVFSSVAVQVNLWDGMECPSNSSGISTPMVPCLNLGALSGCTEEFSESLLSSEYGKSKSVSQLYTDSSLKLNTSGVPGSSSSMPPKSFSSLSNFQTSTAAKQTCEGKCDVCGCGMKSERKIVYDRERRGKKIALADKGGKKEQAQKTLSQLELAELLCLVLKDQDHVVPTSPEKENSYPYAFKTLERKINSLKSSVNLQTCVSLLDVLLDKVPSEECSCHQKQNVPIPLNSLKPSLLHPGAEPAEHTEMDCSLLQCLEELDEYTNQVWAKTESFLEVLNSKKCGSTPKPQ